MIKDNLLRKIQHSQCSIGEYNNLNMFSFMQIYEETMRKGKAL